MIKSLPHEVSVAIQPHEPYNVIYWMLCDRSIDARLRTHVLNSK